MRLDMIALGSPVNETLLRPSSPATTVTGPNGAAILPEYNDGPGTVRATNFFTESTVMRDWAAACSTPCGVCQGYISQGSGNGVWPRERDTHES